VYQNVACCVENNAGTDDDDDEACSTVGDSRINGRLKAQVRKVPDDTSDVHSTTLCRKFCH